LSDTEWNCLQQFLPARSPHGKLRRHSLRSVLDASFYLLRTACPWRYLPSNVPTLADCVLPCQAVLPHWAVEAPLLSVTRSRAAPRRPKSRPDCCHYGCAIGENG